jgi:hypothetical protein
MTQDEKADRVERAIIKLEVLVGKIDEEHLPARVTRLESRAGWHEKIAALGVGVVAVFARIRGWF